MATNGCDVNHLESDSLLPPRKRLLAGFKKQNSIIIGNGSPLPSSSSSTLNSNSNGSCSSSSASADVQTHLDNLLLTSQLNDQTQSPEELAQASKVTAALALKVAKAARATADEKALIASKAVAAAKTALKLFASFPAESKTERKNKQKKHVPVQLLYSKGAASAVDEDEDLARRLNRAINNYPRVLRNKKQKTHENIAVTSSITMYDGHDVAGVVDSDSSNDDELDGTRVNGRLLLCGNDNAVKEKSGEESSLVGKRRGRVLKLKKLPLLEKNVGVSKPLAQPEGSNGGVAQVRS